ncbi:MAG: hypothetical protein HKO57_04620, partial [Akkermansiaceae bacterium]|nr:hypothetical protein [Akkermansiaceae bacterium]
IDPLPLTDSYDPARLQFMSASIAPDSVDAAGGTLTWNNVGPLHAGARKTIEVTFLALDPPDAGTDGEPDPADTTNTAASTGALFLGGDPANDANDTQDITINPGGAIGDYLYWDVDGSGTQDAGDLPLQGVVVELTDGGGTVIATTTTGAGGFYQFAALADGTYTVRVASTNFDPNGTLEGFSQTDDPDTTSDNESTFIIDNNDGNPANDSHDTADFGYDMANNVVSGTLWYDYDGDGVQDANEPPIAGHSVGLDTDDDGTPDVFTTTDADGFYSFSDVVDGTYDVIVTGPAGTVLTTPETVAGGPADLEVDADSAGAIDGASFSGNGFGFQPSGSLTLGDTLYVDWDGDGIQGPGEEGLANITVSLYADVDGNGVYEPSVDALVATAVTDAAGNYQFGNLATSGDYLVVVDTNDADFPAGISQTDDPDGTLDSVGVATGLAASDDAYDFGYQPLGSGSIGDTVFVDADGDGIHDTGEAGIASITVTLYEDSDGDGRITAADAVVGTAVTDADGNYLFESLAPGDYLVDVDGTDADLPTGLASDGVTVLNYIPTSSDPHAVTLAAGAQYAGADFGFAPGGGIGNFVWEDLDGDGEFDDTEPPLAGMTVNLYEDVNGDGIYTPGTDLLVDSTTTDASGLYFFDTYNDGGTNTGLPAGDYLVEIEISPTQAVTYDFDGNNDEIAPVTLLPGQNFGAADYGVTDSSTLVIGETVWLDSDGDGLVGANETLLGGVKVELLDGGGTVIGTAYTDSLGNYMFGVPDDGSTYSVRVDESTLPFAGLANTTDRDGDLDSDSGQFAMVAGIDVLDAGFGYQLQGDYDLTGTVFNDTDSSATWESGSEPTYEDVTVYLWYSPDGGSTWINVDSQLTGANGSYRFEGYPPGDYTVSVSPGSPVLIGTDPTTPQNQQVAVVDSDASVDFGFVGTASIGATVFYDTDGDGVQDAGELGIPGIQVTLTYPNGQTVTTTTDANGNYLFEGLGEGPHTITVDAGTLPAGTNQTADPDGTNDSSTLVNLLEGQSHTDGDFGYQAPGEGSIGDRIWADLDSDGAYEPGAGEFGIEGVLVELYDANDPARDEPGVDPPLATTTTDADGLYGFAGLSAGDYIVHIADTGGALDGYDATFDEDGGTVSPDGQAAINLPANDTLHDTADFGYSPNYASISGTVYDDNDTSNDGVINPADDGTISGVTIELWSDPNGDGDPGDGVVVASTVTDSDGNYQFDSLLPGDYVVVERDPGGFTSDADTGGLNDNQIPIDLQGVDSAGNSFLDDGGSLYTVGGQVTDGSDPIPGVTVTLKDGNGNVIDTAVTDANGDYGFPNLPSGDYLLEETNPAGTTGGSDSDGGDPDVIAITSLGGDSVANNFVDTGFTRESISGTVYNDTLENNLIDPAGDTPIGGVTLELVSDTDGNGVADPGEPVITTTLSGTDGSYSFDGLPQGDYVVVEHDPGGATSENDTGGLPADNNVGVTLDGTGDSSGNAFLDDGVATSTISGQVTNGTHPIPGVTITLKNDQGSVITTTVTDSNGEYSFPNLPDGDYTIEETNPDRTTGGSDSDGSANGDDAIAVTLTGGTGSGGNDFVDLRSTAQNYDDFLVDSGLVGGTADAQAVPDGTGTGGNPDGDNASNLLEFALGNPADSGLPSQAGFCVELSDPATGQIDASFTRPEGVEDVIYTLQGSNDLLGAWTNLATIAAGDAAAAPFTVASNGDGSETVTLGDISSTAVGGAAGLTADFGLLRLCVSLDVDQDGTPDTLPSDGTVATDYTATFGYQGTAYNAAQCASFGSSFSHKPVFSGTVDAIAGAVADVSTAAAGADLSGDIAGTGAYYLQVTSGPLEGERWDIAGAGVNSLTLVDDADIFSETIGGASLNTSDGVPSNIDLAGATFEVLPHRTLDDLFDKNGAFAGLEGDVLTGARLLIHDNRLDIPQWVMLILLDDGGTVKWVRSDDLSAKTDQGSLPVSRCMGNYVHPLTGGLTNYAVGVVAGHDLACAFNEGLNLAGPLWPMTQSAAGANGRALTLANGLVGGKSPNLGAELYFWKGDDAVDLSATYLEGYESNFLLDYPGYGYWTDINDRNVTNMDGSIMFPRHRAFLLKLMDGNTLKPLVSPVPAP